MELTSKASPGNRFRAFGEERCKVSGTQKKRGWDSGSQWVQPIAIGKTRAGSSRAGPRARTPLARCCLVILMEL
jgi:hypothetical protein